ncbi:MAG: uracil-DNA glycosylase family protein [Candidatus Thiodiazotropha sp.]
MRLEEDARISLQAAIQAHQRNLKACTACPQMIGPVVSGNPVVSPVILVGQAPGDKEGPAGKPFAWTAGKTLFNWFDTIGLDESTFRNRVYMAAVCRCFPGKKPKGGDRVPDASEIAECRHWLDQEISLLQPRLIIPVGKLAILQFLQSERLVEVVGHTHRITLDQRQVDIIPLPHPSGASTWHRTEPGKTLLGIALQQIAQHPAWQTIIAP